MGTYQCACKQGLYLPATLRNASITYLNGSFLERLYFFVSHKRKKASSKDQTFTTFALDTGENDDSGLDDVLGDLSSYEDILRPLEEGEHICLSCAVVCEGTIWCTSYPPCSMVGDLAFRLPLVLLTMVTMIGAGCLLILTIKFRNDKVRTH